MTIKEATANLPEASSPQRAQSLVASDQATALLRGAFARHTSARQDPGIVDVAEKTIGVAARDET